MTYDDLTPERAYAENVIKPTVAKIHEVCLICGKPQSPEHRLTHDLAKEITEMVTEWGFMPAFGLGEE